MPNNASVRDIKPLNSIAVDQKPNNAAAVDTKPANQTGVGNLTDQLYTVVIPAGQSMGLLLALTYTTAGTVQSSKSP